MKLARSLIGVLVANEPFATEYFCNLFPPQRWATVFLPPDRPALAQVIADRVTEIIFPILRCVISIFRFPSLEPPGVAQFEKNFKSRDRFAGETAH